MSVLVCFDCLLAVGCFEHGVSVLSGVGNEELKVYGVVIDKKQTRFTSVLSGCGIGHIHDTLVACSQGSFALEIC